jgi:hypothetical protein
MATSIATSVVVGSRERLSSNRQDALSTLFTSIDNDPLPFTSNSSSVAENIPAITQTTARLPNSTSTDTVRESRASLRKRLKAAKSEEEYEEVSRLLRSDMKMTPPCEHCGRVYFV